MKSTFALFLKEVKHNIISFLLVVLAVFLCVSVASGMLLNAFFLKGSVEEYYDDSQMWDIKIKSTLGFTKEDVIAVSSADGVEKASAVISCDSNSSVNGVGNFGTYMCGIDFDSVTVNPDNTVAAPRLIKGSYPSNANSCVAVVSRALKNDIKVGDVVSLNGSAGYCTQTEFTVTGLVYSPEFLSYLKEKNSVNANGTEIVIFVSTDAFSPEATYTEINITLLGASAVNSFSRNYTLFVNTAMGPVNVVAHDREQKRGSGLSDETQSDIDKLLKQYDYIKAEGERELKELSQIIKNMEESIRTATTSLEEKKSNLDKLKQSVDAAAGLPEYSAKLAEYNEKLSQYQSDSEINEMNKATREKLKKDYENLGKLYKSKEEEALRNYENAKNNTQTEYSQRWTMYTRDSDSGFESIERNIGKLSVIFALVSIIIILLSAMLIVATVAHNMQKRIKEVSVLSLSGYDNRLIRIRVISLYAVAVLIGLILGSITCVGAVCKALSEIIGLMYSIPTVSMSFLPYVALTVGALLLAVSVVSACLFLKMLLKEETYELVYGTVKKEPPKLPTFPVIQKLPTFLKITIRNIFAHRISFLYGCVTVMLITALLFTGFNVLGRENNVYEKQYTQVQKYNMEVQLKPYVKIQEDESFMNCLDGKEYLPVMLDGAYLSLGEKSGEITAVIPTTADKFDEFININGGFTTDSVVITEGFAKKYGIKNGTEINILFDNGIPSPVTVTAVTKNYLGDYIYIHPEKYTALTATETDANTVFINCPYEKITDEAAKLFKTDIVYSVLERKVRRSTATLETSKTVIYTALTLGALILIILYYVTYKNRSSEIKALKFSSCGILNTISYLLTEMAVMWLIGAVFGLFCGALINLPFALLNLDGINLSPFISGAAVIKTIVLSFDIVLLAFIVNLIFRYKKTDR